MARKLTYCPLCDGKLRARRRKIMGYIKAWDVKQTVYECKACKVRALVQKLSY